MNRRRWAAGLILLLFLAAPAATFSGATSEADRSDEALRQRLTDTQYRVTQMDATEPAFDNKYWNHTEPGIYVDVVSGEALFSSLHKYRSGTGWPSFYKPLEPKNIVRRKDYGLFTVRTEVRSREANSHLGHVFDDGPPPTGKRYCINSAALRFVPLERLEEEGYGEYRSLFTQRSSGDTEATAGS